MPNPQRGYSLAAYLAVALAALAVGLISHWYDQSPAELTFIKVLTVPLLASSMDGVAGRFDLDEAYRRWTGLMLERVAAASIVAASGLTILLARAESPLIEMIYNWLTMFAVFVLLNIFGPLGKRRPMTGNSM